MNFHQLNNFIVTGQKRSFAQAADALYISVNSLIQQINALESELGFRLFNRSQRGIQLTPSGQMFLTGAKSITADMDILIKQCSEYAGKGMVTIGFPKGGRFLFINRIIEKCSEECPEIKLTFISSPEDRLQNLLNRNLDIQIFPGIPSIIQNPSLQFDTLFYSKLCCVYNSPSDFPDTAVLRSSYFRGMDVILDDSEWKELIPGICKVAKSVETIKTTSEVYSHCGNGKKYILPERYARLYEPFRITPISDIPDIAVGVVYRTEASPAVKTVVQIMKAVISEMTEE